MLAYWVYLVVSAVAYNRKVLSSMPGVTTKKKTLSGKLNYALRFRIVK